MKFELTRSVAATPGIMIKREYEWFIGKDHDVEFFAYLSIQMSSELFSPKFESFSYPHFITVASFLKLSWRSKPLKLA